MDKSDQMTASTYSVYLSFRRLNIVDSTYCRKLTGVVGVGVWPRSEAGAPGHRVQSLGEVSGALEDDLLESEVNMLPSR